MSSRILVAAFGDAGHAFPAIALARALHGRGHEVAIETWEQWREAVEELGLRFQAAEAYDVFPPPPPGERPGAADAARALAPLFEDFRPEVVVSDILTLAPALAAEVHGCRRATLIPHLFPVHEPGLPFFGIGSAPARTAVGRRLWRAALPVLETGLRIGRRELNETRASLGLPALERFHGGISEKLVLLGTYPELEYPRKWPVEVRICGPLSFELPHPDVELPAGEGPLVLVASSTAQDRECQLIRRCFEALRDEPVQVLATTNGHRPSEPIEVPANGRLVDWLSYTQGMAAADLVVCHGGHGTICRAIDAGAPLMVSPSVGDMAENGARVQWSGCGLTLPSKLRRPDPIRRVVRELLGDERYRRRAAEIAAANPRPGAEVAADAVEELLAG